MAIPGFNIPTPFGSIKLPDLEPPPMALPKMPSSHERRAIGHAAGGDLASLVGMIPVVGVIIADPIQDMHHAELNKEFSKEERLSFDYYNKLFPNTIAAARVMLFKK